MFGWFKSDRPSRKAIKILNELDNAIREIHPGRFIFPDDAKLEIMPRLVTLNRMMGNDPELRFSGIQYDQWIIAISRYDANGTIEKIEEITKILGDKVISAMLNAAIYEISMKQAHAQPNKKNLRYEIRSSAGSLLSFLNMHSSTKREPDPSVRLGSSNS